MKKHTQKLIAPVVITVFLVLYLIGYTVLCFFIPGIPTVVKLVGALIFLLLAGCCVYVLTERIKEIRSGEEDDLDNY